MVAELRLRRQVRDYYDGAVENYVAIAAKCCGLYTKEDGGITMLDATCEALSRTWKKDQSTDMTKKMAWMMYIAPNVHYVEATGRTLFDIADKYATSLFPTKSMFTTSGPRKTKIEYKMRQHFNVRRGNVIRSNHGGKKEFDIRYSVPNECKGSELAGGGGRKDTDAKKMEFFVSKPKYDKDGNFLYRVWDKVIHCVTSVTCLNC